MVDWWRPRRPRSERGRGWVGRRLRLQRENDGAVRAVADGADEVERHRGPGFFHLQQRREQHLFVLQQHLGKGKRKRAFHCQRRHSEVVRKSGGETHHEARRVFFSVLDTRVHLARRARGARVRRRAAPRRWRERHAEGSPLVLGAPGRRASGSLAAAHRGGSGARYALFRYSAPRTRAY